VQRLVSLLLERRSRRLPRHPQTLSRAETYQNQKTKTCTRAEKPRPPKNPNAANLRESRKPKTHARAADATNRETNRNPPATVFQNAALASKYRAAG
jgi:hypothetical protein